MARAKAATSAEFPALLAELNTMFPGDPLNESSLAAMDWLLALWITRDADAAAAWVVEKNNGRLVEFVALLANIAPEKFAPMLAGPLREQLGKGFLDSALRTVAETTPLVFLKVDPATVGDAFPGHYARAMRTLARTDPAGAAELWRPRGTGAPGGKDALYNIVGNWIAHDPQAARRWVDALPDGEARRLAQHAWLGSLAKQNPRAALRALAGMDLGAWMPGVPGGMDQPELQYPQDARLILVAALARQDLPAAIAEMEKLAAAASSDQPAYQSTLRQALATSAAEALPSEPAALFAAFAALTGSDGQPLDPTLLAELRRTVVLLKMTSWNSAAKLEALRLVEAGGPLANRAEGYARSGLAHQLLNGVINSDPQAALAFIRTLPETERWRMAQLAIDNFRGDNLDLLQQAATMLPPALWNSAIGSRLAQWPEQTAPLLTGLPHNESTSEARAAFAKSWADDDPEAAAHWVTSLPNGAAPAARGLTAAWAAYDDTAASTWTASLPPGATRDGAAAGLATSIAAADPESAWQWAASISDTALSASTLRQVARQWGQEAPPEFRTALTAALDRAGLPEEQKSAALRSLEMPRPGIQPSPH